jgi:cytochrome c6
MVLRIIFVLTLLFLIVGCSNESSEVNEGLTVEPSGKDLYSNSCAACHGADGKLGAGGASDLSVSKLSKKEAKDVVVNGRGAMQSQKFVFENNDEIEAVIDYIEELKK